MKIDKWALSAGGNKLSGQPGMFAAILIVIFECFFVFWRFVVVEQKKDAKRGKTQTLYYMKQKNARLRAKLIGDLCHHKYEGGLNEFHFLKKFAFTN